MPVDPRAGWAPALLTALVLLALPACRSEERPLRIGVIADCKGGNSIAGQSRLAGAELPLLRRGARPAGDAPSAGLSGASVAGRPVELILGCDDSTSEGALEEARRLVEGERVDVLVGPATWASLSDYARARPAVTFLPVDWVGQSVQRPVPNLFSFVPDAAQVSAGLGTHAYRDLGWREAVVVGDAWSADFVAGFVAEFCSLGGKVVQRVWLPDSIHAYGRAAARARRAVDGYFVGVQTVKFAALVDAWPDLPHALGGRVLAGFISVFAPELERLGERLVGVAQSPYDFLVNAPGVRAAERELARSFPEASLFDTGWTRLGVSGGALYFMQVEALLRALEATGGELGERQRLLRPALAQVALGSIWGQGTVRLDENRHAVWPMVLTRTERRPDGTVVGRFVRPVGAVDQTYGGLLGPGTPRFGPSGPPCRRGDPPPWAR